MRKRRGGMSTLTVGLVALVVTIIGVYLGFTKSIPFRSHYEVKAAFKSANNLRNGSPVRIAGVEVGKVTKVERARKGDDGRGRDDADPGQGPPAAPRRALQDPPAHLPRGQLLRRRHAGHLGPQEVADNHTFPVQQTDTPVQLDQVLTALQTDTREDLKTLLREYGGRPARARARRASTTRSSTGSRPTATRRSSPRRCSARRSTTSPATSTRGGVVAGALDRHREQLKDLITNFHITAGAFARENTNLEAAIAELPRTLRAAQPALDALNRSFPGAARLRPRPPPGRRELRGDDRRLAAAAQAAARARLAGRSCAG